MHFLVFDHGLFRAIVSCLWIGFALAWVVVFVLWVHALMKYCKVYREYEQTYGKPYQSPLEANKCNRVMLKFLRRIGFLLGKQGKKLCHVSHLNANHVGRLLPLGRHSRKDGVNLVVDVHDSVSPNDTAHGRVVASRAADGSEFNHRSD